VLGDDGMPNVAQYGQLAYITRCICESMRLYPHPPVLLRRARVADTLPGGYEVGGLQGAWLGRVQATGLQGQRASAHAHSTSCTPGTCAAPAWT
jgi:hypothetical protein